LILQKSKLKDQRLLFITKVADTIKSIINFCLSDAFHGGLTTQAAKELASRRWAGHVEKKRRSVRGRPKKYKTDDERKEAHRVQAITYGRRKKSKETTTAITPSAKWPMVPSGTQLYFNNSEANETVEDVLNQTYYSTDIASSISVTHLLPEDWNETNHSLNLRD
jgi:hypothetical protein